jgi:hypothetical protein
MVLVGDGIAHVYGLNKIQAREMVDYSVLVIYPPSATNAKNKKVLLLVQLGFFFAQQGEQSWLSVLPYLLRRGLPTFLP